MQADLPEASSSDQPFAPFPQQEGEGPGGIARGRTAEVGLEGLQLGRGAAGAIQLGKQPGEGLHGVSSSSKRSASKAPSRGSALIPSISRRYLERTVLWPWVT